MRGLAGMTTRVSAVIPNGLSFPRAGNFLGSGCGQGSTSARGGAGAWADVI